MFAAIGGFMAFIIIALIILFILSTSVRIVPQARALVVERLGAYLGTYGVGIHFLVPFIDRVARKVDLREQVEDFPPQPVITKDNVTMQIDTVVFYYITDPKLYAYGVERPLQAIENLTATTPAQYHRRSGAGRDADLPGDHQCQDAGVPGHCHGSLGHQGDPGGA